MNDLPQLSTFVLVVNTGSFTRAGNKLGISATAVSKQLDQLEKSLGVTLLKRTTRHLEITELGKIIYDKAVEALDCIDEIKQFSASLNSEPSGKLRISALVAAGEKFLLPYLKEFLERYPNICVDLLLEDRTPSFENNIDIIFGVSLEYLQQLKEQASAVAVPIYSARRIVCAAPSYLKKFDTPKTIQDLSEHCYVTHHMKLINSLETEMKKQNIAFKRVIKINNTNSIVECGLAGIGIIQTLDFFSKEFVQDKKLIPIMSYLDKEPSPRFMLYKKQRYIEPKILLFKEFILKKINNY